MRYIWTKTFITFRSQSLILYQDLWATIMDYYSQFDNHFTVYKTEHVKNTVIYIYFENFR